MSRSPEIDAYIAAAPPKRAERLIALRDAVHRAVPGVTESIEWKMPVYRFGENYVATAAQKNYLSVYIGAVEAAGIAAASGLKGGKGCLNITDSRPLPVELIEAAFGRRLRGESGGHGC